jgi:two-component system sensor histidine kinase TtrS
LQYANIRLFAGTWLSMQQGPKLEQLPFTRLSAGLPGSMRVMHSSHMCRDKYRFMKFNRVILLLSAGLVAMLPGVSMADPQKACTIGVLAHRGPETAIRMWTPTADYLSSQITDCNFQLVPLDLDGMHAAEERGELDFILTNPGHYVELEARHGVSRIATLINDRPGGPSTMFGAVIFTGAHRKDIQTLADLKGKSFAAVEEAAFGGFQMAWRELKEADVDPFNDLRDLRFMGFPQDDIVYAVRDGRVDAGTVRTDILERMANKGVINLADFNVLNPRESEGFSLLHSTRLYPEWAFAKSVVAPGDLARNVSVALLLMPRDDQATRAGKYIGWTVPLDYNRVHELFQELGIGPYQVTGDITFMDVLRRYWYWLALLSGIILFSVMLNIFIKREVVRRTIQLTETNRELQGQILERRRAEKEVRDLLGENRMLVGNSLVVQENERRHLARELHDELGQCITAIQADAEIISGFAAHCDSRLVKSAQAIKDVSTRIYDFVHSTMLRLRPNILEDLGLAETLREEVDAWRQRHPDTHCTLSINTDLDGLNEHTEITIYRIIQECLTNIAKYAHASTVTIDFDRIDFAQPAETDTPLVPALRLTVRDDGVGMDPKTRGRGLGLIGIRERAGALDGMLSLQSTLGQGVAIVVTVPLGSGLRSQ